MKIMFYCPLMYHYYCIKCTYNNNFIIFFLLWLYLFYYHYNPVGYTWYIGLCANSFLVFIFVFIRMGWHENCVHICCLRLRAFSGVHDADWHHQHRYHLCHDSIYAVVKSTLPWLWRRCCAVSCNTDINFYGAYILRIWWVMFTFLNVINAVWVWCVLLVGFVAMWNITEKRCIFTGGNLCDNCFWKHFLGRHFHRFSTLVSIFPYCILYLLDDKFSQNSNLWKSLKLLQLENFTLYTWYNNEAFYKPYNIVTCIVRWFIMHAFELVRFWMCYIYTFVSCVKKHWWR